MHAWERPCLSLIARLSYNFRKHNFRKQFFSAKTSYSMQSMTKIWSGTAKKMLKLIMLLPTASARSRGVSSFEKRIRQMALPYTDSLAEPPIGRALIPRLEPHLSHTLVLPRFDFPCPCPLCLCKAFEALIGLFEWVHHDRLRVLAIRFKLHTWDVPQFLWNFAGAKPVVVHVEVRLLGHPNLVHASLHEEVFPVRTKLPIGGYALPIDRRLASLEILEEGLEGVNRYDLEVAEKAEEDLFAVFEVDAPLRDLVALQPGKKPVRQKDSINICFDDPITSRSHPFCSHVLPSLVKLHGIDPSALLFPLEQVEVAI